MGHLDEVLLFTIDWRNREQTNLLIQSLASIKATLLIVINDDQPANYTLPENSNLSLEYHRVGKNIGFAAACNIALGVATQQQFPLIMHFNNDITVESPEQLETFTTQFTTTPEYAVASPTIFRGDGTVQYANIRWLSRITPALIISKKHPPAKATSIEETRFFHGGCFIARTVALNSINGFDETYFAYREEHDLAHRLSNAGWKIGFLPHLSVSHQVSASSSRTPYFRELLITRGQLIYLKKNLSGIDAIIFALIFTLKVLAKTLNTLLKGKLETTKAVRDAFKNQLFNKPLELEILGERIDL